jgi:hypothetical protein
MKYSDYFSDLSKFAPSVKIGNGREKTHPFYSSRTSGDGTIKNIIENSSESSDAKFIELIDIKTEDLEWISEAFPNVELLSLSISKQKNTKLKSLKGIEKLKTLKAIHFSMAFDQDFNLNIDFLPTTVNELIMYNSTIDFTNISNSFRELTLVDTRINNLSKFLEINSEELFLKDIKNVDGTLIECKSQSDYWKGQGFGIRYKGNSDNFKL